MKNWKTTVTGICAVVTSLVAVVTAIVNGTPIDYATVIASIMAGIGLITAKDSNVTGGTKQQ